MLDFDDVTLEQLADNVTTLEELDALEALWKDAKEAESLALLADLRKYSVAMIKVVERMHGHMEFLAKIPGLAGDGALSDLRERIGAIQARLHDSGAMGLAEDPAIPDPGSDAVEIEGATTVAIERGDPLELPRPKNSTKYVDLADEYVRFFNGAAIRPSHKQAVREMANTAWRNRARYQAIGQPLGVPWWFIAGLHQMESTYNFNRHLHNGQSLTARTTNVPLGHPKSGSPPFTFEESATDALKLKQFDQYTDWSLPRALYRFEVYNGLGYRRFFVATPYLWSFTTLYLRGKYVSDGQYDGGATSKQCGVGALLRQLVDDGRLNLTSSQFADVDPSEIATLPVAIGAHDILQDGTANPEHPFEAFWQQHLSDIQHFTWKELLFKGASNAALGTNTDPPQGLYPNVIPMVRALEEIRSRIGGRIRLLSIYRSKRYNDDVGGKPASRHMKFDAADFQVIDPGHGTSSDWWSVAKQVRSEGFFTGGIGVYNSFVHIDTRGQPANWDLRT